MKILLLGANGQVGGALLPLLGDLGEVIAATRNGRSCEERAGQATRHVAADLADPESLARALDGVGADIVVNAAAYTAVDRAEEEAELADRINHRAVGEIGTWAARNRARVVHYSTDYVFAGTAATPYREEDATSPLGVYGRSKLAGECALHDSGCVHLVLRTAWVYAARGHNFLRTMLRLAGDRDELRIVDDQIGAPTPAVVIAQTTIDILRQWGSDTLHTRESGMPGLKLSEPNRPRSVIFHLATGGRCSWFEFASTLLERARDVGLIERVPRLVPITTAQYPTPAQRPAFSVLDCAKLERQFGLRLPTWQTALQGVIDGMKSQVAAETSQC